MPDPQQDRPPEWTARASVAAIALLALREFLAWMDARSAAKPSGGFLSAAPAWLTIGIGIAAASVGFLVNSATRQTEQDAINAATRASLNAADAASKERNDRQEAEIQGNRLLIEGVNRKVDYLCQARTLDDRESGRPTTGNGPCSK